MKPIVKKTLASKKTRREKLAYLLYVYKEFLIGFLIVAALLGGLIYSYATKVTPELRVSIATDAAFSEAEKTAVEKALKTEILAKDPSAKKLSDDEIAYTAYAYGDSSQREALLTVAIAGSVDYLVISDDVLAEVEKTMQLEGADTTPLTVKDIGTFQVVKVADARRALQKSSSE